MISCAKSAPGWHFVKLSGEHAYSLICKNTCCLAYTHFSGLKGFQDVCECKYYSVRVSRRSVGERGGSEASTAYNAHTFYIHIYIVFERNWRRRRRRRWWWYFWKYTAAAEYIIIYGKNTRGGGGRIHRWWRLLRRWARRGVFSGVGIHTRTHVYVFRGVCASVETVE